MTRHATTPESRTPNASPPPSSLGPRDRFLFATEAPIEGTIAMPPGGAWSRVVKAGATLYVVAGRAWGTFEGDPEDHILAAPAAFSAPRHGRLALQPLEPARFALEPEAPGMAA